MPIAHANGIVVAKPQASRCGFMIPNQTHPKRAPGRPPQHQRQRDGHEGDEQDVTHRAASAEGPARRVRRSHCSSIIRTQTISP